MIMKEENFLMWHNYGYLERKIYRQLSDKNQRLVRHMASHGLFFDPVNSDKGCLYFDHVIQPSSPMHFKTWKEVREYVNDCVFE